MRHCETCKWWIVDEYDDPGWGTCKRIYSADALVNIPSYYAEEMETRDIFGCVQHETTRPRPTTDPQPEPPAPAGTR